jgi:hypothetical protein
MPCMRRGYSRDRPIDRWTGNRRFPHNSATTRRIRMTFQTMIPSGSPLAGGEVPRCSDLRIASAGSALFWKHGILSWRNCGMQLAAPYGLASRPSRAAFYPDRGSRGISRGRLAEAIPRTPPSHASVGVTRDPDPERFTAVRCTGTSSRRPGVAAAMSLARLSRPEIEAVLSYTRRRAALDTLRRSASPARHGRSQPGAVAGSSVSLRTSPRMDRDETSEATRI